MSCIYKISSKDPTIAESYVGKTKDIIRRWRTHKSTSKGKNLRHLRLYDCINKNGGIDNWKIDVLEEFEWGYELARQKERYWYEKLHPQLNDKHPGLSLAESNKKSENKYLEVRKKHRHEHKVEKIVCLCGMSVSRASKAEHLRRGRHLKHMDWYMNSVD